MGYRIQYGKTTKLERSASPRSRRRTSVIQAVSVAAALAIVAILGRFGFLDFLIPGDKDVTKSALHAMLENVREGERVKDAIAAFCAEILDNADYGE